MIDCQLPQLDLCKSNIFLLWREVNGLHSTKVQDCFRHENNKHSVYERMPFE